MAQGMQAAIVVGAEHIPSVHDMPQEALDLLS